MQKRIFPVFSILLLLISLVAPSIQPVVAAEKGNKAYQDGEHKIPVQVLKKDDDDISSMQDYVKEDSTYVQVKDGEATVFLTLTNASWITSFQVHNGVEKAEAAVVRNNEEADTREVSFKVADLDAIADASIAVDAGFYNGEYDVRLQFNTQGIPIVEKVEDTDSNDGEAEDKDVEDEEKTDKDVDNDDQPDEGEDETSDGSNDQEDSPEDDKDQEATENGESEEDESNQPNPEEEPVDKKIYEDGTFKLDYTVDVAAMDRYMEKPAQLKIDNAKNEVTVRFNSQEFIANYEVEQDGELVDATKKRVDDKFVDYTFQVDNLDAPLRSKVTIDAYGRMMEHEFNITFDTSGLKEAKPEQSDIADGKYDIDFDVLHESEDKTSSAAAYIASPAQLSVEDGVKTVYFLIKDHEAIKDFKIEQDGELESATVVETDATKNTRLVAFEVDDFDTIVKSQFKVSIPAMNYEAEPFARIQFDADSIKKADGELPEVPTKPELQENGTYTMNMRVLEQDEFQKSDVGSYIKNPIDLTIKEGENIAYLTLMNSEKVKDFKIERKADPALAPFMSMNNLAEITNSDYESVQVVQENKAEDTRIVSFAIDDLNGQVNALISIEEDGKVVDYPVRLFFEENSMLESDGLPVEEDDLNQGKPDEDLDASNLAAGVYTLDYTFLEKGTEEPSTMDSFTAGPAYIKVDKNGNKSVAITLTGAEMIKQFKVNDKVAKVLQVDQEEDTKVVEFLVKDVTKKQSGAVHVEVPGMYDTEHEVDLVFDTATLSTANTADYPEDMNAEQEEPENPNEEEKPSKPGKPDEDLDASNLAAGIYTLDYTFLGKGTDEPSTMDGFTSGPAFVKIDKKGNQSVAITLTGSSMIKQFKVNGKIAKVLQEDMEEETKVVEFPVKDITKKQSGAVHVEVPGMYDTEHEVDLVFDTATLATAKAADYPEDKQVEQAKPEKPEKPDEEETKPGLKEPVDPNIDPKGLSVGTYQIDYSFLEKGTDKVSIMDDFTSGPANVKKDKKGNQSVAITFKSASYIKGLEINGETVRILQRNMKDDTMIVEFPVADLTKKQSAWVSVDVPGVYATDHEVDLVFHTNTLTALETYPDDKQVKDNFEKQSKETITASSTDDQVPGFDRHADGALDNGKRSGINPKTADLNMTQIILLALLLTGSMIPLVIKLRRKMAAAK